MSSLYQIEKLEENNFDGWKVHIRCVLISLDLWGYVDGSIPRAEDNIQNGGGDSLAWDGKDQKALSTILLSMKRSQLGLVKNCKTSREAWTVLQQKFCPQGPARKVLLFRKLLSAKMSEKMVMTDHLRNFSEIVEKLVEVDITIPEPLLVIILLNSLSEEFENFVVAIESRDALPGLEALKIKLLEDFERRKSHMDNKDEEGVFLMKSHDKKNFKSNKPKMKCFKCGEAGHFAKECRKKCFRSNDYNNFTKDYKKDTQQSKAMLNGMKSGDLQHYTWVFDSGSTSHLCCDSRMFSSIKLHEEKIELAGEFAVYSKGIGEVRLRTTLGDEVLLQEVLYVPQLTFNFISITKVVENKLSAFFCQNEVVLRNDNIIVLRGERHGQLYVCSSKPNEGGASERCCYSSKDDMLLWHERFGHLNVRSLSEMSRNNMVRGISIQNTESVIRCETCYKAKMHIEPFPKKASYKAKELLEIVHTDICGPMHIKSCGGAMYFALFIDDHSRMMFVYFLKNKGEIYNAFCSFIAMAERQTGKKLKVLRSDNAKEYLSKKFATNLDILGIKRQLSVEYTPQQNGVAERANRTITEMARCMLIGSGLHESFWAEAVGAAVYIRNRSLTTAIENKTPIEIWTGVKPTVGHLRIFGCKAIILNKRPGKSKLEPKGIECVLTGYSTESKAYRLFDLKAKKLYKSRDVKFLEHLVDHTSNGSYDNLIQVDRDTKEVRKENNEEVDFEEQMQTTKIVRNVNSSEEQNISEEAGLENSQNYKVLRSGRIVRNNYLSSDLQLNDNPETVKEVMSRDDNEQWLNSMKCEFDSLISKGTWILVDRPKDAPIIKNKWVFTVKRDQYGNIERYKSRLVAKGCSQKYGVNYSETFSPVTRYSTVRLVLALAAEFGLHLHQLDVTTAYLNGDIDTDIYMEQPEEFVDSKFPNKVCKLQKALYGLKQSGRKWNEKLDEILQQIGFSRNKVDPCAYTRHTKEEKVILIVYVDDILIACSKEETLKLIKQEISSRIEIVDKGPVGYFLGMEIERKSPTGPITINQKKLIMELLEENNMINCKRVSTPLDPGQILIKCTNECIDCKKVDVVQYQSLVGSLMYIGLCTRPDILHSMSKLAQFNTNPHMEHLVAAKHVLRYLNNTTDFKLHYKSTGKTLHGFADADWAGNSVDRKSYTGFVFILANGVINFESKKQQTVALSSTESEYMAISSAAKEIIYLRNLLHQLGFENLVKEGTILYGDNIGAQQLVRNPVYHSRSKHIDIKVHHVRDVLKSGKLILKYVPSSENTADILTKSLGKMIHQKHCVKLGML